LRTRIRRGVAAFVAISCALVACADIFGIQGGVVDDASVSSDGGNPNDADAGAAKDVITIGDANFAVCDGGLTTLDPNAIYISPNGSDVANCGTQTLPCATISHALGLDAGSYYILAGLYNEHVALTDRSNVTLQGGWVLDGGAWTQQCSTDLTKIKPDAGSGATLTITSSTGVVVSLVWIETPDQAAPGEALYAASVSTNSVVNFNNVLMVSQNAGAGANGGMGSSDGGLCALPYGDGGAGSGGPAGGTGSWSMLGFVPFQAMNGTSGNSGIGGSGAPGSTTTASSCSLLYSGDSGSGVCQTQNGGNCSGLQGDPGCAGVGGSGGIGGIGGAPSVALLVWGGSIVTLNAGALFTANGGNGGNGGAGGLGGIGMNGNPGMSTSCCTACSTTLEAGCGCSMFTPESGGEGGIGGNGGAGGSGGGGLGGPTYLIVVGGDASVSFTPAPVMEAGAGGSGGTPNGNAGVAGNILNQ
jgi:hypothetical protein